MSNNCFAVQSELYTEKNQIYFMSSEKQISIIGATGNLGVPVAKNLVSFGYKLKIIARNEAKAKKLFRDLSDIEIVTADLQNESALKKALKQTKILYLNLSTHSTSLDLKFESERDGIANIIKAIDKESIQQIILISGLGALDNLIKNGNFRFIPNIIRKQGQKIIKESGIPYTILHCSWFIDSFVLFRRNKIYSVFGETKNPVYFTNCFDYSLVLSNAINNCDAFYKEFPVQGVEGINHPEAAESFFSIFSNSTKVKIIPPWIINVFSLFNKEMKFLKHMSDYSHHCKETFLADECDTYKVLGSPEMSILEYANMIKATGFYDYLQAKN